MKHCPTCNRVENDDRLAFCRVDGTALADLSGSLSSDANTVRLNLPPLASEFQTRVLGQTTTDADIGQPTAQTTMLPTKRAVENTRSLRKPKLKLVIVLIAVLVAVAVSTGVYVYWRDSKKVRPIESIAVMPFANESGDENLEYLSDGMTEALISSLSQLPNLNVKPRSTVFRYKGKQTQPQSIGAELKVQAVLTGRVVQRGTELSLFVELVDLALDSVVWSEQYQRQQTELVNLQREIARDVTSKLQIKLSGSDEQRLAKKYTPNPEAYQLYLKGRFYWGKRTPRDSQKAVDYFQQATTIDPNYALAFAGLADAHTLLATFGGVPRESMPRAREAALKSISLDAQSAEPYVSLGHVAEYYDYDFVEAERRYKRAIELNPNYATAHEFYGTLLSHLGRHQEAEAEFRRALELEPLSLGVNRMYGEMLLLSRRYDESVAQLKKTIELDESFASAHRSLARSYLKTRDHEGHVAEFARHYELIGEPQIAAQIRESFSSGGWKGYLQAMTAQHRPARYFFPFYAAMYYAELGEIDKAVAELEKTYEERLYYIAWMESDPCLDALRGDSRYQQWLRKIGLQK